MPILEWPPDGPAFVKPEPEVTLSLPTAPVIEDQFLVKIGGRQCGIATQRDGKWVLFDLGIQERGRFDTLFALLRWIKTTG